jgi:uncharacterized protein with HEPN domain
LSPRTDVERLADMRAAVADIRRLTAGDRATFDADRHIQQAVAYNLAVLGEAARSLAPELRMQYPDVPWRGMIAQRNFAVHEYHHLDSDILWITARKNIPPLDQQLAAIEEAERHRASRDTES